MNMVNLLEQENAEDRQVLRRLKKEHKEFDQRSKTRKIKLTQEQRQHLRDSAANKKLSMLIIERRIAERNQQIEEDNED